MVAGGYGRILLVSSGAALGIANEVHYASAKAGLQGMARTLAVELGKFGVTANAIAPGFIDTEMTRSVGERRGRDFEEFKSTSRPSARRRRLLSRCYPVAITSQRPMPAV